jgi:hypothetical protein
MAGKNFRSGSEDDRRCDLITVVSAAIGAVYAEFDVARHVRITADPPDNKLTSDVRVLLGDLL